MSLCDAARAPSEAAAPDGMRSACSASSVDAGSPLALPRPKARRLRKAEDDPNRRRREKRLPGLWRLGGPRGPSRCPIEVDGPVDIGPLAAERGCGKRGEGSAPDKRGCSCVSPESDRGLTDKR